MNITVPNKLNAGIVNIGTLLKENEPPNTAIRLRHINDLVTPRETPQNLLLAQPKECVTCKNYVNEQDSCYFVWQDMCFCDTICLHWYQKRNLMESCSNCFGLLCEEIVGKYVFRFDQLLQFCSIPCFHEYQAKRKSCIYCMGKILSFSYKLNQHDPRYCSQDCVIKHLKVQGSNSVVVEPNTPCYICKTNVHPITIQYQTGEDVKNMCNKYCLQTFAMTHKVNLVQCSSCKTYFTPTSSTIKMTQENLIFMFCSKKCETFYVFFNVKVFPCGYCNTKRFDVDLIKRYSKLEPLVYMCSIECYLKRYSATLEQPVAIKKIPLINVPSLRGPLSPIMENVPDQLFPPQTPFLSVKIEDTLPHKIKPTQLNNTTESPTELKTCIIVKPEPSPDQKNVATMCSVLTTDKSSCVRPKMFDQSIQTDPQTAKQVIIPIPVPIYVATPMHMFSVPLPCPVPFPLPIPVPIFIPTTRKGAKRIFEDIQQILDQSPRNPEESEVLAIAEALSIEANKEKEKDLTLIDEDVNAMFSDDMLEKAKTNEMENISKEKSNLLENVHNAGALEPPNCQPKTPANILDARLGIHAWLQWLKLRHALVFNEPQNTDILLLSTDELGNSLALFVKEVKRPNGKNYAPDTIFYLSLSIQKYFLEHNRNDNIFFDICYNDFIENLDEQMKTFSLLFVDSAYIVTRVEEEHLWESGQLGTHSPFVLLNTVLYNNMKYFKLKTVKENMTLLKSSIIFKQENKENKPMKVLRLNKNKDNKYNEMVQNLDDSMRCPISFFEFYISKTTSLDHQDMKLYLEPEPRCARNCPFWYSTKPLDSRHLEIMINRLSVVKELNTQIDVDDLEE